MWQYDLLTEQQLNGIWGLYTERNDCFRVYTTFFADHLGWKTEKSIIQAVTSDLNYVGYVLNISWNTSYRCSHITIFVDQYVVYYWSFTVPCHRVWIYLFVDTDMSKFPPVRLYPNKWDLHFYLIMLYVSSTNDDRCVICITHGLTNRGQIIVM